MASTASSGWRSSATAAGWFQWGLGEEKGWGRCARVRRSYSRMAGRRRLELAGVRGGAAAAFWSLGARRRQKSERNGLLGFL